MNGEFASTPIELHTPRAPFAKVRQEDLSGYAMEGRSLRAASILMSLATILGTGGRPSQAQELTQTTASAAESQATRPILRVDAAEHDFGVTWIGAPLEHTFIITNGGNAVLRIAKVHPSCGCTVAGPYPETIEPGASGKFPFSLNVSNVHGTYMKMITIVSNDPATPELTLRLRGTCKRYVEVTPEGAYFGVIDDKAPRERVLKIANNASAPLKLTLEPQPTDSRFKFELTETRPGEAFELRVSLLLAGPPGNIQATAVLQTNIGAQKTVDVRAVARIPERIDIVPTSITITRPVGNVTMMPKILTQLVRLTNHGQRPVHLLEATADDPNLKVAITQQTPGKFYVVAIRFAREYQLTQDRTLTLKTDDAERPVIRVPIRCWPPAASTTAPATRASTRTTTRPARPAEQMAGKIAPAFSLKTMDGKAISGDVFAQKAATVLNFVAPNCPHCRKQVPMVEKVRADYEPRNVRFVNISEIMGRAFTDEAAANAFRSYGSRMELATDPGNRVGASFKATSYPVLFVIRPDGRIERVIVGDRPEIEAALRAQLDATLSANPSAPHPAM